MDFDQQRNRVQRRFQSLSIYPDKEGMSSDQQQRNHVQRQFQSLRLNADRSDIPKDRTLLNSKKSRKRRPKLPRKAVVMKRRRPKWQSQKRQMEYFCIPECFTNYQGEKTKIPSYWFQLGADAACGGNVVKFFSFIEDDLHLWRLFSHYPQHFIDFIRTQHNYWPQNQQQQQVVATNSLPAAAPETCDHSPPSSVFLFSCVDNGFGPEPFYLLRQFTCRRDDNTAPLAFSKTFHFPDSRKYTAIIKLGSFIYFIGGQCTKDGKTYASKMVSAFNTADLQTDRDPSSLLVPCSNMNVGKTNPLAFVSRGKIYVISSSLWGSGAVKVPNGTQFDPDYNPRDWTLVQEEADWFSGAFEVYDPTKDEWTILPLPCKPARHGHGSLFDYSSIRDFTSIIGRAVVHDKLFFFSLSPRHCVHTFDTQTLRWKYYDEETRGKVSVEDYYDALAYELVKDGIFGQGFVVKDTLYSFLSLHSQDDDELLGLWAYHIPKRHDDKNCHSGPLKKIFIEEILGSSPSMPLQASLVSLGSGSFCCIHGKMITTTLPPREEYVHIRPVVEKRVMLFKVSPSHNVSPG